MAASKQVTTYYPMDARCRDYQPFLGTTSFPGYQGFHCHDFYEFYIFFSGAHYYSIGGQITPLKPCTLIIIPPFRMHGLVGSEEDTRYERAWLYITPAMIRKAAMGISDMESFFRSSLENGRAYFTIERQDADRLRSIITEIRDHMSDPSEPGKWQNSVRIAEFLSCVYSLTQHADSSCRPVVLNETIHSILTYINDHYQEPITIPELSRRFGISASYMAREFTTYTGGAYMIMCSTAVSSAPRK